MISLISLGDVLGCDPRLTGALTRLGWNVARLATLKDDEDDGEMIELLMLNVHDSVDDGYKVHAGELTELIAGAQSMAQTGWATEGRLGGSDLVESSCLARAAERLVGLRKENAVGIHAKIPARGKAPRTRWPTRIGKRLAQVEDDAAQREIVERDERERWIKELHKLLKAGAVPALAHLMPEAGVEVTRRFAKGRRAGTLRKHVKTWERAVRFWRSTFQICWPTEPMHVACYFETRAAEPCGKSVPTSIFKTLLFMESSAEIEKDEQLSQSIAVKNALQEVNLKLETGQFGHARQALHLPLKYVVALEELVMRTSAPRFVRAYAWYRLFKLWGALRFSDTSGLLFHTMRLESFGISADLARTKTSGPGKKVKLLKVFVSVGAFLKHAQWLPTGWSLWEDMADEVGNRRRDFFLLVPTRSLESCARKMANYAAASAMSQALTEHLLVKQDGVWSQLLLPGVSLCWSEHSERVTLRSWARTADVPEDICKTLGRWTPSTDQTYDRSIRMQVLRAQDHIAQFLRANQGRADPVDECQVMARVAEQMADLSYDDRMIQEQVLILMSFPPAGPAAKRLRWSLEGEVAAAVTASAPTADPSSEESDAELKQDKGSDPHTRVPNGTYVISVVGRSHSRTLHRVGECFRMPGLHFRNFEIVGNEPPKAGAFHKACKVCFPRGADVMNLSSEEESSGDASSSDTEGSVED